MQHVAGGELAREGDVMDALKRGVELTFTVDLSECTKQGDRATPPGALSPLAGDASEYWTARVTGECP